MCCITFDSVIVKDQRRLSDLITLGANIHESKKYIPCDFFKRNRLTRISILNPSIAFVSFQIETLSLEIGNNIS